MNNSQSLALMHQSLNGLSVGDAFGELFFSLSPYKTTPADLPTYSWPWTDDTHMALSVVDILSHYGHIEQDALARAFAKRFRAQPFRGYAGGAVRLLAQITAGADWRIVAPSLFHGGSYGNGAAMRVGPIGAYFAGDLPRVVMEAQKSAAITHAHPEGQAGAIAVAVAAALAATAPTVSQQAFLQAILAYVPPSEVRNRTELAISIPADDLSAAMQHLGTGSEVSAQDTVPFCLWSAAYHLDDYEAALWWTVKGGGDCDTTCAIVGSIVALSAPQIPPTWLTRREALPTS